MNLAACATLPRAPENSTWYRAIQIGHLPAALNTLHTAGTRSRFNPGPLLPAAQQFESLYLASDQITAAFEFRAMFGIPGPGTAVANPYVAPVILNVTIVLVEVVDLSSVAVQGALSITAQELTGDWDGYQSRLLNTPVNAPVGIAPTQELGASLFRIGIEGFRAISARIPYNRTLVVFPANLRRGSSVTFSGQNGTVHQITGSR